MTNEQKWQREFMAKYPDLDPRQDVELNFKSFYTQDCWEIYRYACKKRTEEYASALEIRDDMILRLQSEIQKLRERLCSHTRRMKNEKALEALEWVDNFFEDIPLTPNQCNLVSAKLETIKAALDG
jgi:hypothetical protein